MFYGGTGPLCVSSRRQCHWNNSSSVRSNKSVNYRRDLKTDFPWEGAELPDARNMNGVYPKLRFIRSQYVNQSFQLDPHRHIVATLKKIPVSLSYTLWFKKYFIMRSMFHRGKDYQYNQHLYFLTKLGNFVMWFLIISIYPFENQQWLQWYVRARVLWN